MTKKLFGSLVVAGFVLFLGIVPAQAVPIIDFHGFVPGGSIEVSGGNVKGDDIPINIMTVLNAPVSGTFPVTGLLDFDTSTKSISITDTSVSGYKWFLTGTISTWDWDAANLSFHASGSDEKNPDLLAKLGIPQNTQWAFFGFSLAAEVDGGKLIGVSTDIKNTAVPEPGTILLLGAGLLGLGLIRRKRQTRD